ncbi:MAG: nitrite/sulfite reductase, partial [Hansschlegelia sp.]
AVYVGGGQGRTPMVAKKIRDFLPEEELLAYVEAIMRVYNLHGRRDNKYKARIKILVHETGAEEIARQIEAEFLEVLKSDLLQLPEQEIERITAYFAPPELPAKPERSGAFEAAKADSQAFAAFAENNVVAHKTPGYGVVTVSLKAIGAVPGDASAEQMDAMAELAERYSHAEIRVSHEQNLVLPHVALDDLPALYAALAEQGLATGNAGLASDIICCPGLDYCALANARSIPLAQDLSRRFGDPERQKEIGELKIKISGCINACGHHHVGHIGLLGVDRRGEEVYQITLGGSGDETASVGTLIGPGFLESEVAGAVETVVATYLQRRTGPEETFLAAVRRLGQKPFKEALYGAA